MVGLVEENVMRLKLVELTFDPKQNVVIITGRNRQGKSCLLDGIAMALGGERLVPARPIRSGQKTARVEVALSNGLRIERRFTSSGSSLRVRGPEGDLATPQALLDRLMGDGKVLAFDPSAFSRMSPADQANAVKAAAGLDFSDLDKQAGEHYEARRDIGRDLRAAQARLAAAQTYPDIPAEEIDTAALLAQIAGAHRQNNERLGLGAEAKRLRALEVEAGKEVQRLEDLLAKAKAAHEQANQQAGYALERALTAPLPVDVSALEAQVRDAETTNAHVRANKVAARLKADVAKAQTAHDEHERALAEIAEERGRRLGAAKMPIPGLTFGEQGVLVGGLPLAQASQAEQVELAARVAVALQPNMRLILMREGSLLDAEAWDRLYAFAEQQDAMILVERVGTGQPGEVVIEDGEIVAP